MGAAGGEGVHGEAVRGEAGPKVGGAAGGKLDDGAVGTAEARRDGRARVRLETAVGVREGVVHVLHGVGARVVAAHDERQRERAELEDLARAQLDARRLLAHVARAQELRVALWPAALHRRAPVVTQGFSAPTGRNRWGKKQQDTGARETVNQAKHEKMGKVKGEEGNRKPKWEEKTVTATRWRKKVHWA